MEIVVGVCINYLLWIKSLEEEEKGVTTRTLEDLIPFFDQIGLRYRIFEPTSALDFLDVLREEAAASQNGLRPIIHFDMHGSKDRGVRIVKSNEFVPWQVLIDRLRTINVKSNNNLCVIAPVCFSFAAVLPLADILRPSPFNTLIAPEETITAGFIESNLLNFYKELFAERNFAKCYNNHLSSNMSIFESVKIFVLTMCRYIASNCFGSGGRVRRERLLTEILNLPNIPNTPQHRAEYRKFIKKRTAPTQEVLDQYAKTFLIDTRFKIKMRELLRMAKSRK